MTVEPAEIETAITSNKFLVQVGNILMIPMVLVQITVKALIKVGVLAMVLHALIPQDT